MEDTYHYRESGLSNVYLANGFETVETNFGESVHIQNVEALHEAIGSFLVECPVKLKGESLKFLRTQLNMTQIRMGKDVFLHKDGQSVALWEKDKEGEIPGQAEIILRSFYKEAKSGAATHVTTLLQKFAEEECAEFHGRRIEFQNTQGSWVQQQEKMCA